MDRQQRLREENDYLLKLWQSTQAGDKGAFADWQKLNIVHFFTYATNFTNDRDFIKDAIQEIFIRIWERRATLTIQVVSVYLYKTLRNQLLQELRRSTASVTSVNEEEANDLSDWQTIETEITQQETDNESQFKVRQAIHALPKRQREIVFLKFYKGLENEQIAEMLEINRQSVANLLFRALNSLKNQMAFSPIG